MQTSSFIMLQLIDALCTHHIAVCIATLCMFAIWEMIMPTSPFVMHLHPTMLKSVTKLPDENVWQTKFPTDTCQTTSPS
jgi:hypothetical protein